jgi:aminoglycoside phosphotransferase (APT) family kinase protein
MTAPGTKLTSNLKNNWGCLLPPFSAHDPNEGTRTFSDQDAVIQTGLLDPSVLAKHLRGNSLCDANGDAVKEVEVRRVLKHHVGKRCTLEIALQTGRGWQLLIAKIYRKDHSDVFQTMGGIQQAGFGTQDEFSIPQPLAYLGTVQCLLEEKVEGTFADEIFKTGDELHRAAAARRCAMWLARFHALGPKVGSRTYANDHLNSKSMQRYSREIGKLGGRYADKVACLHQRLEDAMPSLSPAELCAGHGSYSAAHVILGQGRTAVIDWDGYDLADPARDVARFLAALRLPALGRLGSIRALDGTAEVFLNTYLAVGHPEVKKNLRFFEAATCLNLARHTLCRPGPRLQGKQDKAEAMLDEGFRVLDGETI